MSGAVVAAETLATPTLDLSGRTALVTGAGTGIGAAVALGLARAGASVALTYRTHDASAVAQQIAATTGAKTHIAALDVTDAAAVTGVVDEAAAALGGSLDILVNNAGGLVGREPLAAMSEAHWHTVLDLNLTSVFIVTRATLRHMPDGGRIVNISSQAARNGGGAGASAYAAAKAGVHGLTLAWAKELGERGIGVNAIAPGFIDQTPFHQTFTSPENQRMTIDATPLRRAGVPGDVAGAVLYLASELGAFCTGEVIDVNGGTYL